MLPVSVWMLQLADVPLREAAPIGDVRFAHQANARTSSACGGVSAELGGDADGIDRLIEERAVSVGAGALLFSNPRYPLKAVGVVPL